MTDGVDVWKHCETGYERDMRVRVDIASAIGGHASQAHTEHHLKLTINSKAASLPPPSTHPSPWYLRSRSRSLTCLRLAIGDCYS
jgi:hypothetical protein